MISRLVGPRRAGAAFAVLLLVGCGGTNTPEVAAPSATAAPTLDAVAATAAITTTWETFFNPAGTVDAHAALLENGSAFTAELTASSKDPAAANLSAKVTNVEVTSATTANVTYNLLGKGGAALLTGSMGAAVLQGSDWKVSTLTYCQLINLQDPTKTHAGCA